MIRKDISACDINLGDLVFILHKEKPTLTGWYRKIPLDMHSLHVIYVMEKSVHPKTNNNIKDRGSVTVIKNYTLHQHEGYKYEVLVRATGISATLIIKNDYQVHFDDVSHLTDMIITERGMYLLQQFSLFKNQSSFPGLDYFIDTIRKGELYYESK